MSQIFTHSNVSFFTHSTDSNRKSVFNILIIRAVQYTKFVSVMMDKPSIRKSSNTSYILKSLFFTDTTVKNLTKYRSWFRSHSKYKYLFFCMQSGCSTPSDVFMLSASTQSIKSRALNF